MIQLYLFFYYFENLYWISWVFDLNFDKPFLSFLWSILLWSCYSIWNIIHVDMDKAPVSTSMIGYNFVIQLLRWSQTENINTNQDDFWISQECQTIMRYNLHKFRVVYWSLMKVKQRSSFCMCHIMQVKKGKKQTI